MQQSTDSSFHGEPKTNNKNCHLFVSNGSATANGICRISVLAFEVVKMLEQMQQE